MISEYLLTNTIIVDIFLTFDFWPGAHFVIFSTESIPGVKAQLPVCDRCSETGKQSLHDPSFHSNESGHKTTEPAALKPVPSQRDTCYRTAANWFHHCNRNGDNLHYKILPMMAQ